MAKIKITQIRSLINKPAYQRKLVKALGIHKTYNSVIKEDTPSIRASSAACSILSRLNQ